MTTTADLRPVTLESFKTAVECINANGGSTSLERVPATLVKKGLLVQVKPGGRGNRKSRFALTPAGITLALSLANSACTTIIVQAPDDEDGSTSVASFDSWPMPADASSTSGEPADQTTGEQVDGSTSGEIDEASSTGDTSTGEIDGTTSGSTGDGSTSTGSSGGDTASSTSTGDTGSEAMLEPVGCAPAAVGVNAAFTGAIQGNCGCHGGGAGGLTFNDMASFKAATVNVMATNADMQRITPGDINESYLLYKLHGQQLKVPGGGGSQMPFGGPQLSDTAQCLMINWVKGLSTAKALGEMCVVDDECESGACIGSGLEDFNRCSTPCTLDAADDCSKQGHPGICLWSGGDQHYCGGSFPTEATFFGIATPPPPNSQPWSTSGQIANPSAPLVTSG